MAAKESTARVLGIGTYSDAGRVRHRFSTDTHPAGHPVADALLRALGALDQCIGLADRTGRLHHSTQGLAQLLTEDTLRAQVTDFVRCVWACAAVTRVGLTIAPAERRSVDLNNGTYSLTGTFVGIDLFGLGATVLVGVTPPTPDPLRTERLQQRFRLTRAQVRVARLLALGLRNDEISGRLFLSSHTVRHHIEQIRDKVGGHTRAALAARLRGEA